MKNCILHTKKFYRIIGLILVIVMILRPVAAEAVVARSVQYSGFSSSELTAPRLWTVSISGNSVNVIIRDDYIEDGTNAYITFTGTGVEKWGNFYSHTASLALDISSLGDGNYQLILYKAQNPSISTVWSFANYVMTKSGSSAYFCSPAGQSEKDFLADITTFCKPEDYDGLPWVYTNNEKVKTITDKAVELCKNASSDEEKVRIIHEWIAKNFSYDMESLYNGNAAQAADAIWAYENKRAVCSGFARLAKIMFCGVGIPCINVEGTARSWQDTPLSEGQDYTYSDHEWNVVWFGGSWHILDITWDCKNKYYGSFSGTPVSGHDAEYTYYGSSPELFGSDHISMDVINEVSKEYKAPTPAPTSTPTPTPTSTPTPTLTSGPTLAPTQTPPQIPTQAPTYVPTQAPTSAPTPVITSTPDPDEDDLGNIIEYNGAYYELTDGSTPTAEFLWVAGKVSSVNIGGTVSAHGKKYKITKIADFAFEGNKNIKEIIIGSGVKTIGKEAFSKCSSLERVVIGKDVTTIGASAFYKCKSLRSVTLPSKLKKISSKAFYFCANLEEVIVTGTKLKKIGSKAFKGTGSELVITVPESKLAAYKKLFKKSGISREAVTKSSRP